MKLLVRCPCCLTQFIDQEAQHRYQESDMMWDAHRSTMTICPQCGCHFEPRVSMVKYFGALLQELFSLFGFRFHRPIQKE